MRVDAKSINFRSPISFLTGQSSNIYDNLNNSSTLDGTTIFDYNLGSLIVKPAVQGPAGSNASPQIMMAPTTITLFDTITNFNPTNSSGTLNRTQFHQASQITHYGQWATGNAWPNQTTFPFPIPISQQRFKAAHDGYITAVEFAGLINHCDNNNPDRDPSGNAFLDIFAIKRNVVAGATPPFSSIDLMVKINNSTTKRIGTLLSGPSGFLPIGTIVRSPKQKYSWRFTLNPSDVNSRIAFKEGETLSIGIEATSRVQSTPRDTFRVNFNNLGGSSHTFLKTDLTVVYLPKF